jgi:Magnesium transporter NIPA
VLLIGFGLAIASSLALNAGYLLQHVGGGTAPAVDARRPVATVRGLLRSPLWVVGMGTNLFGSVLHIGALAVAPITLVQAFSAAGLALVVPASARVARSPLHRAERVAVGVIIAALALLAISPATTSVRPVSAGPPLLFLASALAGVGVLAAVRGARRGAALALIAGLLYGLSDAATKGFTDAAGHGLLGAVLSPWPPIIVALCAGAFFALQRSLQLGAAATVIVLMTATMNVIAVAAGVAVFAESFGAPMGVAALHLLAMVAIAAASWRLAAVQARIGERRPVAPSAQPVPLSRRRAAPLPAGAR